MQKNAFHIGSARAVTFALAVLAALSATYWVLKSTRASSVPIAVQVASSGMAALDSKSVARALGGGITVATSAPGADAVTSNRFVLVGVLAEGKRGGAALVSVDGKPAKPYAVGATVDGSLVLQSVAARRASLSSGMDGPVQITLELPPLSK